MNSLFDETSYTEIKNRIQKIETTTQPQWGKMTAAQMFAHNIIPLEVVMEKRPPVGKPNFLMKLLFKKMMYNDKWYGKNLPTPAPFKVETEKEFEEEKQQLLVTIDEIYGQRNRDKWPTHAMFGDFTPQQTGQMLYKHLDHHLRQFGV